MVEIFEQVRTNSEMVKGVIRFADGSINVIKDAGIFTVPEIGDIAELLDNGDNKLRGKERREDMKCQNVVYSHNRAKNAVSVVIFVHIVSQIRQKFLKFLVISVIICTFVTV